MIQKQVFFLWFKGLHSLECLTYSKIIFGWKPNTVRISLRLFSFNLLWYLKTRFTNKREKSIFLAYLSYEVSYNSKFGEWQSLFVTSNVMTRTRKSYLPNSQVFRLYTKVNPNKNIINIREISIIAYAPRVDMNTNILLKTKKIALKL